MKRIIMIISLVLTVQLLSSDTYALKRFGSILQIEHGKPGIVMCAGEKQRLHVCTSLLGLPVYKGLHFSSSNLLVVSVDSSGVVHAGSFGRAYVTVVDGSGRTDSILITVAGTRKGGLMPILIFIFAAAAVLLALKFTRKCKK